MKKTILKTRKIHGKDYVEVNERLKYFRVNYPGYAIQTAIINCTPDEVVMSATVLDAEGVTLSTGHAHEEKSASNINKTSYVENCETSAIGRALGIFGIGLDGGVATAEEVELAIARQELPAKKPTLTEKEIVVELDKPQESPVHPFEESATLTWTAQEVFGTENPMVDAFLVSIGWLSKGQNFTHLDVSNMEYAVKNHENLTKKAEQFALSNNSKLGQRIGAAVAKGLN